MVRKARLKKHIEILRRQRSLLVEQYHVATLEVFGSYVRNEENEDSDLDILVTFTKAPSLLKLVRLENYLSDTLGVKVDLVIKDSLKPELGENILREAVPV